MAALLEFGMLFAFGFSWPFAIARTYRAKRVDGKSPMFMVIVILGYCCENIHVDTDVFIVVTEEFERCKSVVGINYIVSL